MVDENGRISRGNDYDKLEINKLDIFDKIEGCFIGQITNIDKENNVIYVKKHYVNKNNNKVVSNIIPPCVAVNLLYFNFPYNLGDIVVVLSTRISAKSFILNNLPAIHNVYKMNDLYEEINNIIIFNLTKADLTNQDTITIPFGDIEITIKKDGSYTLKNKTITINFDKDGNITLDNQKGQIKLDNQGQITIKNNQAMLDIDQVGLFSIQNNNTTLKQICNVLNTAITKALTNIDSSVPKYGWATSPKSAQAFSNTFATEFAKLLK